MVLLGLDSSSRVKLYFSEFDLDEIKKKNKLDKAYNQGSINLSNESYSRSKLYPTFSQLGTILLSI